MLYGVGLIMRVHLLVRLARRKLRDDRVLSVKDAGQVGCRLVDELHEEMLRHLCGLFCT